MTLISDKITQVWEGVENTVGKSVDVVYRLQKSCDQRFFSMPFLQKERHHTDLREKKKNKNTRRN
ncbi:MAG TPA: hypothetical protein VJ643_01290 [Nitrososphaera sp.]|nr:hypothetical protein [Nitrososphaera sp.]